MIDDVVIIDVGKSGSRLWATVGGESRTGFSDRGISPTEPGDHGQLLAESVAGLLDAACIPSAIGGVVVGATCDLDAGEKRSFESLVRRRAPAATLVLSDDGVLAHARTLASPGIVLSVGTGVIGVAMSPGGLVARVDGWGPLLGDRGSAAEVGLRGLRRAVLDQESGRASVLVCSATRRFGVLDLRFARRMLGNESWPRLVASFAADVALAADQGDADSMTLLQDAAAAIVGTALTLRDRCESARIAIVGRFGRSRPFAAILEAALTHAGLVVVEPRESSPELSAFVDGPYRDVVSRWRPDASAR